MSGLLGFLISSAVFAIVGAALRGLIRPISWGLLAIATLLLVANRVVGNVSPDTSGTFGDMAQEPEIVAPVSPVSPPEKQADEQAPENQAGTPDQPVAIEGWQDVAEQIEPILSEALADPAQPSPLAPDELVTSPNRAAARQQPQRPTPPATTEAQTPIQGFW